MVIDGTTVITGSFNFTQAAEERNAENLLVIRDKVLADRYEANWHQHEAHAQPVEHSALAWNQAGLYNRAPLEDRGDADRAS